MGTFLVAVFTGFLSKQKAANEDYNTLLEIRQDTLRQHIAEFQHTRDSLITANNNLKQNSELVVQKIKTLSGKIALYDSAINVQKGTVAERSKFVAKLLQRVSNLTDKNQQLEQSIASANTNTFNSIAAFRSNGGSLSGAGSLALSSEQLAQLGISSNTVGLSVNIQPASILFQILIYKSFLN